MRFTSVLAIAAGSAIGYVAARHLASDDGARQVQQLPSAVREPLLAVSGVIERGQARMAIAWSEGRAVRDETEAQLRREYHERTHPQPSTPADSLDSLI